MSAPIVLTSRAPLRIAYGGSAASQAAPHTFSLALPWLGGATADTLFGEAVPLAMAHGLNLFESDGLLIGYGSVLFSSGDPSSAARDIYRRLLAAVGERHLYRVWNYVPRINAVVGDLENYRAFCQGRSLAFEDRFGGDFQKCLSAASAVGCDGDQLQLVFVAGTARPRHVENPEQVPAYRYPAEHGPRPPSFARATGASGATRAFTFISGTAAIKGHHTVAPGALADQLACTLDNLRLISAEIELGRRLGTGLGWKRHFKVYLRHASDLAAVQACLERELLEQSDEVIYLRADICRVELNVEIEATLVCS